NCLIY
ncbi:hypothetical protein BVZ80_01665B, partial [Haemophilus influenzae]